MTATLRRCIDTAGTAGGVTTRATTLSSLNAGDDVLVATFTTGAQTITGVSDGTNTYAKIGSATGAAGTCELWAALNVAASATPKTITATWSAAAAFASIWAADVAFLVTSGLLDHNSSATGSSFQAAGSNLSSTALGEMQIGLVASLGGPLTTVLGGWSIFTSPSMHSIGFGVAILSYNTATFNQLLWNQTSSTSWAVYQASLNAVAAASYVTYPLAAVTSFRGDTISETAPRPSYVYSSNNMPNTFRRPAYNIGTGVASLPGTFRRPSWPVLWPISSTHGVPGSFRPPVDVHTPTVVRPNGSPVAPFGTPSALFVPELGAVVKPDMSSGALPTEGQVFPPPMVSSS